MLHRRTSSLTMHLITIHQRIFQQRCNRINVILSHIPNIFKHERERLEHSILNVQFWNAVLIHNRWQHSEGGTRLCNNGNCHSGTNAHLSILHLQIVQQRMKHILWSNRLGNIPKRRHGGATNRLLVCLEHLEQLETNTHPFLRRNEFSSTIGNTPYQINAILLHLLMPIPHNRGQPWQQITNWRSHLRHTNHIDNRTQRAQNRAQHFRIFFTQILIQHHTQMPHELIFIARLHYRCNPTNQIRSLHAHRSRFVVEAPFDRTGNLLQIRSTPLAQSLNDSTKTVQHDLSISTKVYRSIVHCLFLKSVQHAID
mmetsp:Transcript_11968/g.18007  ORF Transcript_11968/g.18007 Transcript_11968/m.18007 type:complete len:312 (+) Transcript_11968:864-1799(+)